MGNGRQRAPCLYVIDFDKAILERDPDDIERLRFSDPVFPRPSQRTEMADYWGAAFLAVGVPGSVLPKPW